VLITSGFAIALQVSSEHDLADALLKKEECALNFSGA